MLSRLEDMRRTCTNLPPTPPGFVFSPQPASKRNGNVQIQFLHREWKYQINFTLLFFRLLFHINLLLARWCGFQRGNGSSFIFTQTLSGCGCSGNLSSHPTTVGICAGNGKTPFFVVSLSACLFIWFPRNRADFCPYDIIFILIWFFWKPPPSSTNRKQVTITKYLPLPSPETCHSAKSSSVTSSSIGSHPGISTSR